MRAQRSDAELITASLVDPRAFAPVFERHFATVHRYLARRGGRARADELAGEVFRVAFEHRDRFDAAYPDARPWLLGIATRLFFRALRTDERASRAYSRAGSILVLTGESCDEVDERVAAGAVRAQLAQAIDALAARDRDALLLLAWEGMTYDEIARALGIPIGTVRSRIHRARKQLRELLDAYGQDPCDQTAKR